MKVDPIDLIEECVTIFGFDMRVTAWNREAERVFGFTQDEMIGEVIQAAVRCSPSEPLRVILGKVHEQGIWRGEFVRTTKSGTAVTVRTKWTLRRDADGRPLDIVETSRDISEIRRTEELLNRFQLQYQNLFQASAASFWELDFSEVERLVRGRFQDTRDLEAVLCSDQDFLRKLIRAARVMDINDQGVRTFGGGRREDLLTGLDAMWPDESLRVFAQCVVGAVDHKEHFASGVTLCSLSGERLETQLTVSYPPQLSSGERLLMGLVDVTQARRSKAAQEASERRHKDFFHFLPVAMFRHESALVPEIFDRARKQGITDFAEHLRNNPQILDEILEKVHIVEANSRAVTILRARSVDELLGPIGKFWSGSRDVLCDVFSARYQGKPGFEALIKLTALDATVIDVLFFVAFSPVTGLKNVSLVGLIDVSDRVKAQEMLARVQAEMAHAARVSVLGELTASLAHEVSQPLTAIGTNIEASLIWLAKSPPELEEVRALAARTAAEVDRAADIIRRVRAMAVRAQPEQKRLDLNSMVDGAMLFLRPEFQRHCVETTLRLRPDLPNVLGDRVQLQQVIVNLGLNALQAMMACKSGGCVFTISTAAVSTSSVVIDVDDTGPGFAPEVLERLFESFFTTKATGMGMGLPICRSIIDAHGGQISAANRSDRAGARFTIVLPAQPA